MDEKTYVVQVQGYMMVPVMKDVEVKATSQQEALQKGIEEIDSIVHAEIIQASKKQIVVPLRNDKTCTMNVIDDVGLEWESAVAEEKEVEELEEVEEEKSIKEAISEGAG